VKRKTTIRITAFAAAALAIAVGFAVQYRDEAQQANRFLLYEYTRSMTDLTESMNDISGAFVKGRYAYTPELLASISAEIWQEAEAARAALSRLPESNAPLENTCRFIAQAGDYAFYLMKRAASGDALTAEERAALASLSETAQSYAQTLSVWSAEADAGVLRYDSVASGSQESRTVSDEMSSLEEDFPEYATLIYDGPLSDHINQEVPSMTADAQEVSQADALAHLSEVCGCPASAFTACTMQESNLPAYCFTGEYQGEHLYGEVTRQGGYVLTFIRSRDLIEPTMTPENGVETAKQLAESIGMSDLKETYYWNESGLVIVNLASTENGVTIYPDLVKIGVSLDDGTLVRLETRGYLMNHKSRELEIPTAETSNAETLRKFLTVLSESYAVIPTDGGGEILCREYRCQSEEGENLLVYCDAETGKQRQILILVEDENGQLTV